MKRFSECRQILHADKLQTNGKFETRQPYLDMRLATLFAKSTGSILTGFPDFVHAF